MQKLSQSRYAALIGISRNAVNKAVKAGHISAGIDTKTKKIIVEVANAEWGNAAREKHLKDIEGESLTPSKEYIELSKKPLSEGLDFREARRRGEIYRAEMARIQALKDGGKLVSRDEVHSELFKIGQELRTALLAIPDRVIDDILACKTRAEAHSLLFNAIYDAIANFINMNFNKRESV